MHTKEEVLQKCSVEGTTIKLPPTQLDRNMYLEVKKSLELIGGTWKGGKTQGFVFNEDPTEYLAQLSNGETRNQKKEYQFFATPDELADRLVELANPNDEDKILEPSAGQGAIVEAISRFCDPSEVFCYELMPLNVSFLGKIPCVTMIGEDFLQASEYEKYDVIIANPPFAKNQDIDHIRKMYALLNEGGRLVSISSKHWQISNNKKETDFRNWLDEVGADVQEIDRGAFQESGTMVGGLIIVINK